MLVEKIRSEMIHALKNGDKERKQTLSMLVSALDLAAKEKRSSLSEEEEFAVLRKELKQTKETLEEAQKANREDMIESANQRIIVIDSFLPALMDENAIKSVIDSVLMELGISAPTKGDKGKIMKVLMPKVKGKADGKLVNEVLMKCLN